MEPNSQPPQSTPTPPETPIIPPIEPTPVESPAPAPFVVPETPAAVVDPVPPTGTLAAPTSADPGKTMGIVGLVLAFLVSVAGIIVSAIALHKSKKAGYKNTIALVGLIISIVGTVVGIGLYSAITIVAYNGITTRANVTELCTQQTNAITVAYHGTDYSCSTHEAVN